MPHRSEQIREICHIAFVVKPPSTEKQRGDLDLGGIKPRLCLTFNHNRESKAIVCVVVGSFFIEKEEESLS